MHIGFLTPEYPHARTGNSGGIGTSILNLTRGLVTAGHKVTVLVYGQAGDACFGQDGVDIHTIKNEKVKGFSRFLTQRKIQRLIDQLVKTQGLEIIEAPDWTGITSRIRPKCPVVVRLHGSDTYFCHLDNRPVKLLNRWHEKKALERADGILSVSRFTADTTMKLFGLDREITVVPNGVDPMKFTASGTESPDPTVLYFGTLIRKKGLLELPHIFNRVVAQRPNAKLVLVGKDASDIASGSSSTWEIMKPLFSAEAFKNVTWLGPVDYAQMQHHIATAHVCVFPTFAEALPVSWIEAMAMQKAVVASNIGWAEEIVENESDGFLVHPTRHDEFADRIVALIDDATMRKKIGQAARVKVEQRFSVTGVAAQNESFYLKTIRNCTK